MAVANYAALADVATYAPGLDTISNATILNSLLNAASRFIDSRTGRFFYDDGYYKKYFHSLTASGEISFIASLTTEDDFFPDAVSGMTVELAYFENQPLNQRLTLQGPTFNADGSYAPPTNYFPYPPNPRRVGAAASPTLRKPYYGIDIAYLPISGTTFIPMIVGGRMVCGITAHWGWPAVPDVIKDLTCKMVVRAWKAVQAGHQLEAGSPEIGGVVNMSRHFDERDLDLLVTSELVAWWL